jgi:Domain of unknown function (DUF4281)
MNSNASWLSLSVYAIGWIALVVAPLRHRFCWIFARSCAVALAVGYCLLLLTNLDQISSWNVLLLSETVVSEGRWYATRLSTLHILAFNLFIGSWQVEDGPKNQIPHKVIVPILITTAFAGPLGFVMHIFIRDVRKLQLSRDARQR